MAKYAFVSLGVILVLECLQVERLAELFDPVAQNKVGAQAVCDLLLEVFSWERHQFEPFVHLWHHLKNNADSECV